MRVDTKALEAYRRLGRTPDGQLLHSQLAAELEQVKRTLLACPPDQVARLQGRGTLLEEIVKWLHADEGAVL